MQYNLVLFPGLETLSYFPHRDGNPGMIRAGSHRWGGSALNRDSIRVYPRASAVNFIFYRPLRSMHAD